MKLSDVLNVFNNTDIEDYLEGISYDGDPDTFKLNLFYDDVMNGDTYLFEVHLFSDGEIYISIIEGEADNCSYTNIEIIHIVLEI